MVAEEATNTTPSASAAASNVVVNSPQRQQNLPSPWDSVRGDTEHNPFPTAPVASAPPREQGSPLETPVMESSSPEVQPTSSDVNGDSNADCQRRSNGVVVEAGPVVGGALSESTRPIVDGSASSSQAPQRTANTNSRTHSAENNTVATRPRSRNRGRGGGSSSGSRPSQSNFNRRTVPMPSTPSFSVFEIANGMDASVRGARPLGGIGGSYSNHPSQRNTSRSVGNYGQRPRRDVHLPHQYASPRMGYMPSPMPHGACPFLPPPTVRAFPGQMRFDVASPLFNGPTMPPASFTVMRLPPPLPSMLFPHVNQNLINSIIKQVDYWFSDGNLARDYFLRSNMECDGWVLVSVIASFRRLQQLTRDINVIMEAIRYSSIVEIEGDKVRRRHDWKRWVKSCGGATENTVAASMQHVSLDDSITSLMSNAK